MNKSLAIIFIFCSLFLASGNRTFYIDARNGNDLNTGLTQRNSHKTLQSSLDKNLVICNNISSTDYCKFELVSDDEYTVQNTTQITGQFALIITGKSQKTILNFTKKSSLLLRNNTVLDISNLTLTHDSSRNDTLIYF
jgi:hypothetical protein